MWEGFVYLNAPRMGGSLRATMCLYSAASSRAALLNSMNLMNNERERERTETED